MTKGDAVDRSSEREKMSDKDRGVYRKYHVERVDDPKGKHADCTYFVLDPQHDPIAQYAMLAYAAEADEQGYDLLAMELRDWVEGFTPVELEPISQLPELPYERDGGR